MKAKTWLGRYHTKLQKLTTQKPRKPWRHRSKGRYKHTASEKAALKEKRLAHRITYADALKDAREVVQEQAKLLHEKFGGHSIQYYHEELMQRARMAASSRSPSRWNAFVRREVKRMNQERPPGSPFLKASHCVKGLAARWNGMSKDEQEKETADAMKDLEDHRESKQLALHNVPLNAFQDVRKSLELLDREIHALNARTGLEVVLLTSRSNIDHFNQPHIFVTERAADFFDACLGSSIADVAVRFEAFCIAGVQEAAAAPTKVSRMYYQNFDTYITAKFGIIIENWPLQKFCCLGDISSRSELAVLSLAWESNATRFRKLTDSEFNEWSNQRFQDAMDQARVERDDGMEVDGEGQENIIEGSDNEPPLDSTSLPRQQTSAPSHSVNVVTMANGTSVNISKRTRKPRCDKGQKRGPRTKKCSGQSEADPSIVSVAL
ncbi:hypothetical protein DEU56DRAFT_743179 [Suillus clintonianus]|uniref:uncharacterized protein n=1 Tax=Suillus clintonianus TaxID=1904413 RepID=UPI001B866A32|nr:uncharacterized protein DEU56DRAFT_743179 [Suillus clintonianus]KAG2126017.1 hypothetical protein DEU56DRAFT_743179 [Suillus clintonianus]